MFRIYDQTVFDEHRSGWGYCMSALDSLDTGDDGILLDGFLEDTFWWSSWERKVYHVIPYKEPWAGFLHNPLDQPAFARSMTGLADLVMRREFLESLECCQKIFVLSETMAAGLREAFPGLSVSAVVHPTEIDSIPQWSLDAYRHDPVAAHVGWWLRSQAWFKSLQLPVRKLFLAVADGQNMLEKLERSFYNPPDRKDYTISSRLPNDEYDRQLARSVIVIRLWAASANNTVVEALARATPIFVNRLPAVEEYLGKEYPGYVPTEKVGRSLRDYGLLQACSDFLMERRTLLDLSLDTFRKRVQESMVETSPPDRVLAHKIATWHPAKNPENLCW